MEEIIGLIARGSAITIRNPEIARLQPTEYTPKRTHIAGIITNLLGEDENYFYELLKDKNLKVGSACISIEGYFKDLWRFRKVGKGYDKTIREWLYNPTYIIIVKYDEDTIEDLRKIIEEKKVSRIPYLGNNDSFINIMKLDKGTLYFKKSKNIISNYPTKISKKVVFTPIKNMLNFPPIEIWSIYSYKDYEKGERKPLRTIEITDILGLEVELEEDVEVVSFKLNDKENFIIKEGSIYLW